MLEYGQHQHIIDVVKVRMWFTKLSLRNILISPDFRTPVVTSPSPKTSELVFIINILYILHYPYYK